MDRPSYSQEERTEALARLIAQRNLTTFFQPIVDMSNMRAVGFEVLNRPTAAPEFANAADLYRFASETNRMAELDRLCRELGIYRFAEATAENEKLRTMQVFLNIHPGVLSAPGYHSQETLDMLQEHGLSPHQIVLEITEQGAIQDYSQFEATMSCFNEKGFHIAIDDFGTGYNSLQSIVYVHPQVIKVDRSIVHNIHERERQQKLVRIILQYAREIGALLLAEGVETEAELRQLKQMGVDLAQGYFFGQPDTNLLRFHNLIQ